MVEGHGGVSSKGFNPRPPITAGESPRLTVAIPPEAGFNPRPPITAGESRTDNRIPAGQRQSFNPRPPITAGESERALRYEFNRNVSIRARQLQRANPPPAHVTVLSLLFSIRARQLQRANPQTVWFVPRFDSVSIRARQLQRANPR